MKILPVESGPVYTIGYLVYDENSREAVIIDTPLESTDFFMSNIEKIGLYVRYIILTHSHWDHTAEAYQLKKLTNAEICIHKHDEYRIKNPNEFTVWQLPFKIEPAEADIYLEDGTEIEFGSLKFNVLHTPGHTEGGICLVNTDSKVVFTGDTLFSQSIGRTDLPGGNYDQLMNSINEKLLILPDEYQVLSGHGDPTDIGTERRYNPFIQK